jgi:hypothetical protein
MKMVSTLGSAKDIPCISTGANDLAARDGRVGDYGERTQVTIDRLISAAMGNAEMQPISSIAVVPVVPPSRGHCSICRSQHRLVVQTEVVTMVRVIPQAIPITLRWIGAGLGAESDVGIVIRAVAPPISQTGPSTIKDQNTAVASSAQRIMINVSSETLCTIIRHT